MEWASWVCGSTSAAREKGDDIVLSRSSSVHARSEHEVSREARRGRARALWARHEICRTTARRHGSVDGARPVLWAFLTEEQQTRARPNSAQCRMASMARDVGCCPAPPTRRSSGPIDGGKSISLAARALSGLPRGRHLLTAAPEYITPTGDPGPCSSCLTFSVELLPSSKVPQSVLYAGCLVGAGYRGGSVF